MSFLPGPIDIIEIFVSKKFKKCIVKKTEELRLILIDDQIIKGPI